MEPIQTGVESEKDKIIINLVNMECAEIFLSQIGKTGHPERTVRSTQRWQWREGLSEACNLKKIESGLWFVGIVVFVNFGV